jgi:transformation/transcription domain-associated protein
MRKAIAARAAAQANVESVRRSTSDQSMRDANESAPVESTPSAPDSHPPGAASLVLPSNVVTDSTVYPRQAWEHVDEILQTLKTNFPLLILSLETIVDQIQHKFKPSPEEEVYRTICMLISDAIQV